MPMKFQPSINCNCGRQLSKFGNGKNCHTMCQFSAVNHFTEGAHWPNNSITKINNSHRVAELQRTTTEEPGFNHMAQNGRRAFALEQLDGMVPSHSALGCAASGEDDFGLLVGRSGHLGRSCCVGWL